MRNNGQLASNQCYLHLLTRRSFTATRLTKITEESMFSPRTLFVDRISLNYFGDLFSQELRIPLCGCELL